jgi:hypothetical protein
MPVGAVELFDPAASNPKRGQSWLPSAFVAGEEMPDRMRASDAMSALARQRLVMIAPLQGDCRHDIRRATGGQAVPARRRD